MRTKASSRTCSVRAVRSRRTTSPDSSESRSTPTGPLENPRSAKNNIYGKESARILIKHLSYLSFFLFLFPSRDFVYLIIQCLQELCVLSISNYRVSKNQCSLRINLSTSASPHRIHSFVLFQGECMITFTDASAAAKCIELYNGQSFPGGNQSMKITLAKFKPGDGQGGGPRGSFGGGGMGRGGGKSIFVCLKSSFQFGKFTRRLLVYEKMR